MKLGSPAEPILLTSTLLMGIPQAMPPEPDVCDYKIIYTVINKTSSPFLNDLNKNEQNGIIKYRNIGDTNLLFTSRTTKR